MDLRYKGPGLHILLRSGPVRVWLYFKKFRILIEVKQNVTKKQIPHMSTFYRCRTETAAPFLEQQQQPHTPESHLCRQKQEQEQEPCLLPPLVPCTDLLSPRSWTRGHFRSPATLCHLTTSSDPSLPNHQADWWTQWQKDFLVYCRSV